MSDEQDEFKTEVFDKFLRAFYGNPPHTEVGIIGDKNARSRTKTTNADIGAKHEFGIGVPIRSFLRMPLVDKLETALNESKSFSEDVLKNVVKQGSFILWMKEIGIVAEGVIADAFDSGGFGKWKPSNMRLKKNHQTLVETQQLRNSISSQVKE